MKHLSAIALACMLAACGGGGGSPNEPAPAGSLVGSGGTGSAPEVAPAAGPSFRPAGVPAAVQPAEAQAPQVAVPGVPPRSGRSLNWWGTEPTMLFDSLQNCQPKPDCQIPDGDLAVWNAQCPETGVGREECYVPLSFEPQVRPRERAPLGIPQRPDPLLASQEQIDEWNNTCVLKHCMLVRGQPWSPPSPTGNDGAVR